MAEARPSRPLRRGFGLVSLLVASADVAAVAASSGGGISGPTGSAAASAELPMVAYGVFLLVLGLWCVATSFAAPSTKQEHEDGDDAERCPIEEGHERAVIHALRDFGWYVADDIQLPHGDVDHVAVGPAGILAVQIQWTNRPDSRGKPAARARIAAQQLRKVLAAKELSVEVVPVVLAFGPGLDAGDHGVKVVDTVAVLNGYHSSKWMAELDKRSLLPEHVVENVRNLIGDLREGEFAPAVRSLEPAFAS